MNGRTAKKLRQLIRKNHPNTERMFEAMKGWPFRVRLSLAMQLVLGIKKGARRSDEERRRNNQKDPAKVGPVAGPAPDARPE